MPIRLWQRKQQMARAPLQVTAQSLMRVIAPVTPLDTLGKAIFLFRQTSVPALPVVDAGYLLGWVTEQRAMQLLSTDPAGADRFTVEEALEPIPAVVDPFFPWQDLQVLMLEGEQSVIPVATPNGQYLGMVTRADVLAISAGRLAPPRVGGMATPLGVYLTTGTVSGGVGGLGLMLTGMTLSCLYWVAQMLLTFLTAWLYHVTRAPAVLAFLHMFTDGEVAGSAMSVFVINVISLTLLTLVFLALLRLAPRMAGYHAAEHQTVNAIEAGEPLTPDAVGRMSRVHPRCGTNLSSLMALTYVVVAALIMGVATPYGRQHIDVMVTMTLLGVAAIFLAWRKCGTWLQTWFTTRPASPRELASGIRAGEEILQRHLLVPAERLSFGRRLLSMGLIQVSAGVLIMGWILQIITSQLDGLWQSLVK